MADEKRKSQRLHAVHLVSYTKLSSDNLPEVMGIGKTLDLGEGGLKLETRERFEVGDVLHLEFTIEGKVIKTDARVAHVEEVKHYRIGFQFGEGFDPDELEQVKKYLADHGFKPENAAGK